MEEIKELTDSFRKEVKTLETLFNKLNGNLDTQNKALQKILRGLYGEEENDQVGLVGRVSVLESDFKKKTQHYDRLINVGLGIVIAIQIIGFLVNVYYAR